MKSDELDEASVSACDGMAILARWKYTLDTSDDENFPFVSTGQLLLRGDGVAFQRVHHSLPDEFGPWGPALRAGGDEPYTVTEVERLFRQPPSGYTIDRIGSSPDSESGESPAEYHSDADGDRYVIVDADDFDLSRWSVEVGQDERWRKQAGFGGWTPEPDSRTYRREFTSQQPWYRSHEGSPWGYLRFSRDEVDHPWSAMVDHGERIVRFVPPDTHD